MRNNHKLMQVLATGLVVLALFGLVLLIWPLTDSIITHAKLYTMLFAGITSLTLFAIGLILNKRAKFISSPFFWPLILFGLAAGISSFLASPYPVENLLGFGGVLIAGVLFVIFLPSVLPKKIPYIQVLGVITTILTILSALQAVGKGPSTWLNQIYNFGIPNNLVFNVAGSSLVALEILVVIAAIIIGQVTTRRYIDKLTVGLVPILLISIALHGWSLLPGKPAQTTIPSLSASWSIMLDSIRAPRSALIGVGPQAYANAYAMYKPTWANAGNNWATIFNQPSNAPFSFTTTMGFLGLIAWLLLSLRIYQEVRKASVEGKPLGWGLLAILAMQLFLPINIVLMGLEFILLTLFIAVERDRYGAVEFRTMAFEMVRQVGGTEIPTQSKAQHTSAYILGGLLLLVACAGYYFIGRSYQAYQVMHQASQAGLSNNVVQAYELEQQAVNINPYLDEFRRRYALTNLSIAIALSNDTEATEEDQQQTSQLVQQAVREARAATTLDPNDWQNWSVLSQIYQNLIPVSEDALQWTIQSYVQAANTYPSNPNIRLALGGVFLDQKNYAQAANIFQQAVNVKPDFPASHYNLALALKASGNLEQARESYQTVLSLLEPDSDDFTQVTKELETLEADIEKSATQNEGTGLVETNQASITDQNLNQPGTDGITSTGTDVDLQTGQPAASATPTVGATETTIPEAPTN